MNTTTVESISSSRPTIPWEPDLASSSPFQNQTQKSIKDLIYNGTGYYIEDEIEPGGLNDLQTLFLACFATLIPLVISLLTAFGIRVLWTRYKRQKENYDGILERSESLSRPLHTHLINDKKDGETHISINTEEVEVCDDGSEVSQVRTNNHSSTNGSIITMTLKNNHLIVETEERNDLEEDSRETTMKYSPGARDGVFVVEVQQGVRRSPTSAVVHHPPERFSEEDAEECEYVETSSREGDLQVRTGLAQSDQSLNGHHSYCYTNQQCYGHGNFGYHQYGGYVAEEPLQRVPDGNKPKITAALYKRGLTVDEEHDEEQKRLGNAGRAEPDVGSGDCENKGFHNGT